MKFDDSIKNHFLNNYFWENIDKSRNIFFFYSHFMIQYCYDFNETRFRLAFGINLGFGYYL